MPASAPGDEGSSGDLQAIRPADKTPGATPAAGHKPVSFEEMASKLEDQVAKVKAAWQSTDSAKVKDLQTCLTALKDEWKAKSSSIASA